MQDPQRILLVRLSHLGDVVHALVVLHALHAAFPRAAIAWAVQPEFAGLIEGMPGLERVIRFRRRAGMAAWVELRAELASFDADLAVDAQGNAKSAAVTLLSGAPRRLGLARRDWREPVASLVLTQQVAPAGPLGPHAMERMRRLAEHVAPGRPLRTDPGLAPRELVAGNRILDALFPEGAVPLLVHLSSPGDVRSWPAAQYRTLLTELASRDRPALVVSGPAEAELGAELAREFPSSSLCAHLVGQGDLREFASLLSSLASRGGEFLGCDSGPLHLAAACGLRCWLLAGPQDARRTGPWSSQEPSPHRSLRRSEPLACAPCRRRTCGLAEGPLCMQELDAAAVLAALGG